jgi:hypothetical protein
MRTCLSRKISAVEIIFLFIVLANNFVQVVIPLWEVTPEMSVCLQTA